MPLSQAQVDDIINTHFMFEATDDVDGVLDSLAPSVEHHVVPSPFGVVQDKGRVRDVYNMIFSNMRGESVTPVRRLYGDGFVVDEAIWNGMIEDGEVFGLKGRRGPVSFRILHVFEFDGAKIKRENVWCDVAAIQQQLGAKLQ